MFIGARGLELYTAILLYMTIKGKRTLPPKPDPCLVSFYRGDTREPKEKDWIRARDCEYGCGKVCKRTESYD